jgi:hypothetical protein
MGHFLFGSTSRLTFVTILSQSYDPSALCTYLLQLRHSVPLVIGDISVLRTFSGEEDPLCCLHILLSNGCNVDNLVFGV